MRWTCHAESCRHRGLRETCFGVRSWIPLSAAEPMRFSVVRPGQTRLRCLILVPCPQSDRRFTARSTARRSARAPFVRPPTEYCACAKHPSPFSLSRPLLIRSENLLGEGVCSRRRRRHRHPHLPPHSRRCRQLTRAPPPPVETAPPFATSSFNPHPTRFSLRGSDRQGKRP